MDFGKVSFFIVPTGNTLPTTGSTQDLTAGQFGVFRPDYSVASAANIAAAQYIYLGQGRVPNGEPLGSKRSEKIYKNNVIDTYKITGSANARVEILEIDDFTIGCGETLSVTLRLFSNYINTAFYNGLTQTVTIKTPCCDCSDDPCTDVDAEALVDELVAAINAHERLSEYVTASKSGTGATTKLVITGKALTTYGAVCDITSFSHEYDAMTMKAWAYKGAPTTQDEVNDDACDIVATVTKTQTARYSTGLPAEIKQLELNWRSYDSTHKDTFRNNEFNRAFTSQVDDSVTAYTTIYIKYYEPANNSYTDASRQEVWSIIAAPATEAAAILTRLELFFGSGAFIDKSSTN